ncbi:MAG: GNAT family N-acetyltransferase [Pyrinomonadaceae bacterium]
MVERETERLYLRQFTPADLDDLAAIVGNPQVMKFLGNGKPVSRDESEVALYSILRHWDRHGFGRWAVAHKPDGKLIGYAGLRSFHGTPELVYLLDEPYWGRGLATELARSCLDFGFREKRFERIIAFARAANHASRRVIERVGMRYEKKMKFATVLRMLGVTLKESEPPADFYIVQYALNGGAYEAEQRLAAAHARDYTATLPNLAVRRSS